MKSTNSIIIFPETPACFPPRNHTLDAGGIDMKVTHQHPQHTSDKERLDKLQELKKSCALKIHKLNGTRSA